MTESEIRAKIKALEEEDFRIGVSSDFLSGDDMRRIGEIAKEIRELKAMLNAGN